MPLSLLSHPSLSFPAGTESAPQPEEAVLPCHPWPGVHFAAMTGPQETGPHEWTTADRTT